MAGHSKWANIKHRKAAQDAKRGKAFTKLIKEITVTARQGGGDHAANARLRQLLEKARSINMPQENITRAIKKGIGELPGVHYEEIMYEGYGPGGIAILIEALTDNRNRTVAELRHLFSAKGGNLAEPGSVNWMFAKHGVIRIAEPINEEQLLEALLEHEIVDVICTPEQCTILCKIKELETIKTAVQQLEISIESSGFEWIASNLTAVDAQAEEKAITLLRALEDHDDVQNVFTNLA